MTEKHEAYLYHVTFNAMHNIDLNDPLKMHAHTFRVGMYVIEKQTEHTAFLGSEHTIGDYFKRYQGIRLNELPMWKDMVPTLENIGNVFYKDLKPLFEANGMQLLSLEIGDSPISVYCIGEKLLLGASYNMVAEDTVLEYCSRIQKRYENTQGGGVA